MPAWKDAPSCPSQQSPGPGAAGVAAPERGLVRRAGTAPIFDVQRFSAGPELEPWVEHLWTVDWDRRSAEAVESTVISFPALHLTAEWGGTAEVRHGVPLPATIVHGAVSRVFRVVLSGAGSVVGARFSPGGFAAWSGADASTLVDRAVPGRDLLEPPFDTLHEQLAGRPPVERADAFRAVLQAQPPRDAADTEVTELVRRMAGQTDLVRVEQLVEVSGLSMRTLQRRFRLNLGVSPKWVLARFRLQEAALALERDPSADLAGLAIRLGWYDQAHLTNDFRRMLGETPAQYAARSR